MTKALKEVVSLAQEVANLNGGAVEITAGILAHGLLSHLRLTIFPQESPKVTKVQIEPWHKPPFNPQPPVLNLEAIENDPRLLTEKEYHGKFSDSVTRSIEPHDLRLLLRTSNTPSTIA